MDPRTAHQTPLGPGDPHGRGTAARPDRATERRLWFGILAGPLMWTLGELVGVATVGRSCTASEAVEAGLTDRATMVTGQWLLLVGTEVVAALVTAAALVVAWRVFRRWTGPIRITESEGWNRVEFMAVAGAIISAFLLLNIIYFGVMPAIVNPCLRTT